MSASNLAKSALRLGLGLVAALAAFTFLSANGAEAAHSRKGYVGARVDVGNSAKHSRYARSHRKNQNVRVASLGDEVYAPKRRGTSRSVVSSGSGNIVWQASSGCLNGTLRSALSDVSRVASIRVNSTCRSKSHNAAVGGAKHSHHLTGDAVDFRVLGGNSGAVLAMLRHNGSIGGIKHYGGGLYHIDTGARRSW